MKAEITLTDDEKYIFSVSRLSERYIMCFCLRFFYGYTLNEIAVHEGISLARASLIIDNARRKLRANIRVMREINAMI